MEASTISYLRAALIERGTEAKRGGCGDKFARRLERAAGGGVAVGYGDGSARGVAMNLRADLNELARSGQGPELA